MNINWELSVLFIGFVVIIVALFGGLYWLLVPEDGNGRSRIDRWIWDPYLRDFFKKKEGE